MDPIEINESIRKEANKKKEEIVVGIDFGTTNSLIAYSINTNPRVINSSGKSGLLPSVISYNQNLKKFFVGQNKKRNKSIYSIKRFLGRSYQEIKSTAVLCETISDFDLSDQISGPKLIIDGVKYSFPELASKIFLSLKDSIEQELKVSIDKAVISVPAYFDEVSRWTIMHAAQIAGLNVLRLIAEPTAAAYAYGFNKKSEGTYMVYDLGGGTFDVSILTIENGVFQVIATGGDSLLGGDDLDYILAKYIAEKLDLSLSPYLFLQARKAKELLSFNTTALLKLKSRKLEIRKETFEKLVSEVINKTIKIAKDTLFDTSLKLDGIILIGGSSRIPLITEKLKTSFNVQIFSDIDPDKTVVIGAALQAENLSPFSNCYTSVLIDVLPLSIGLELYGGITEKIIMRNTTIPFASKKVFTTHSDYQTGMKFHIVQGEREMAKDCRSLARFELKNITPMKAGLVKIEVNFVIDADGILAVTAKENVSGIAHTIELKPNHGLNEAQIKNMLSEAFKNAKEDHENSLLVRARINAHNVINDITKLISEYQDSLTVSEKKNIESLVSSLREILYSSTEGSKILDKTEELNIYTAKFVEKCLNKKLKLVLKDFSIKDN